MVNPNSIDTEQKILNAARKVFIEKGRDGARMQGIADEAGINKSLLHYYFRTKEKLFAAIFEEAFKTFIPNVKSALLSGQRFQDQIRSIVWSYFDMLRKNQFLPRFVLSELSHNPNEFYDALTRNGLSMELAQYVIQSSKEQGFSVDFDPRHLILDMIGMSVIPFLGRPIFEKILMGGDEQAFENFLDDRKEHVTQAILKQIKWSNEEK